MGTYLSSAPCAYRNCFLLVFLVPIVSDFLPPTCSHEDHNTYIHTYPWICWIVSSSMCHFWGFVWNNQLRFQFVAILAKTLIWPKSNPPPAYMALLMPKKLFVDSKLFYPYIFSTLKLIKLRYLKLWPIKEPLTNYNTLC